MTNLFLTFFIALGIVHSIDAQRVSTQTSPLMSDVTLMFDAGENYTNCQWIDSQNKIICTKKGYKGLYIIDPNEDSNRVLSDKLGIGYNYRLINDDQYLISLYTTNDEDILRKKRIAIIDLKTSQEIEDNAVKSRHARLSTIISDEEKIAISSGTEMKYVSLSNSIDILGQIQKQTNKAFWHKNPVAITSGGLILLKDDKQIRLTNTFAYDPIVSPDGKYLCFNEAGILKILTSDLKVLIISKGLNASWHPNSEYIVYQDSSDNGHFITSSELYLFDIKNNSVHAISESQHIHEEDPSFSKHDDRIVFTDAMSGSVFTATLNISK